MPIVANRMFSNNLEGSNSLDQALRKPHAGPAKKPFITLCSFISDLGTACSAKSIFVKIYIYMMILSLIFQKARSEGWSMEERRANMVIWLIYFLIYSQSSELCAFLQCRSLQVKHKLSLLKWRWQWLSTKILIFDTDSWFYTSHPTKTCPQKAIVVSSGQKTTR